ncbi:MAG: hypothetical protein ABEJ67_00120 [Halanaeroarchaeum sp.]
MGELQKVPGIENVHLERAQVEYQICADADTAIYADGAIDAADASVQINWWPEHDDTAADWYQFHYYDSAGFDCGWHRHANDHVDGLAHYQERSSDDADYDYYPTDLDYDNPTGILWETIGDRLPARLKHRYE